MPRKSWVRLQVLTKLEIYRESKDRSSARISTRTYICIIAYGIGLDSNLSGTLCTIGSSRNRVVVTQKILSTKLEFLKKVKFSATCWQNHEYVFEVKFSIL